MAEDLKQHSKNSFSVPAINFQGPLNAIQVGALQRIAQSLENMEQPYLKLLSERERYERLYRVEVAENATKDKRIAALRGVINRMKKERVK